MPNTRRPSDYRPPFDTRASVLAAWFIFIVAIWPILTVVIFAVGLGVVFTVLETLYPGMAEPGGGLQAASFVLGPPLLLVSAVVAAIACYKTCRYITVPLHESKPLAFEPRTVMAVFVVLVALFALWQWVIYRSR
jgi:hypothetical protein